MEIETLKVSSKIGNMFKKLVPEVVLDLYSAENHPGPTDLVNKYVKIVN